ncbi:MAG: AAA family ATPase [Ginsengibacter sp.]
MTERLTIKNFGPIKDMSFEFRKINIFIGDQSTGKSSVAKILSLIKEMFDVVIEDESKQIHNFKEVAFEEQLKFHGLTSYLKSNTIIDFDDSCNYFKYEEKKIFITKGEKENRAKDTRVMGFIPSYREAAILLKNSINALAGLKVPITELFFFFGQHLMNAKLAKGLYDYTPILGIKYKYVNDSDIVILKNGKEIKMEDAASAISSGIPMLLVFDNIVQSMLPTSNRIYHYANQPYIIIEEPELNCFPTTQKKIMEHFISKIKFEVGSGFNYYCRLLITTHSPYILTSLNNMMYAYSVAQKDPVEVNKIIDKKYWVNPEDVSAYMLLSDGTSEDIVDREEGLIKAEKIDGVTNTLNEQFEALLNIELVPK